MKKKHVVSFMMVAGLLALMLASCAFLEVGSGVISLSLSEEVLHPAGRFAGARADSTGETTAKYIRVYLENETKALIPLGGKDYFEAAVSVGDTIEIPGVPTLNKARLYVTFSEENADFGTAYFRSFQYGESEPFDVALGATTEVTVILQTSPFDDLALGLAPKGMRGVEFDGCIYVLADGSITRYQAGEPVLFDGELGIDLIGQAGFTAASQFISLSVGRVLDSGGTADLSQLWVNTDRGIFPFDPATGSLGAEITGLGVFSVETPALESGFLTVSTGTVEVPETQQVAYYQRPGSMGFALFADGAWTWKDLLAMEETASFSDFLGGTAKLVADFFMDPSGFFGYAVVPSIQTFRFSTAVQSELEALGDSPTFPQIQSVVLKDNTLSLPLVEGIKPLATGLDHVGNTLYVGTDRGLFAIPTVEKGALGPMPTAPISLGRRVNVVRVRSKEIDRSIWTAVLGSRGSIYLLRNDVLVKEYRYYTGIPSFAAGAKTSGDLFWTSEGLVITGSDSAVLLPNADLGK